jgi:hypothetical protein
MAKEGWRRGETHEVDKDEDRDVSRPKVLVCFAVEWRRSRDGSDHREREVAPITERVGGKHAIPEASRSLRQGAGRKGQNVSFDEGMEGEKGVEGTGR